MKNFSLLVLMILMVNACSSHKKPTSPIVTVPDEVTVVEGGTPLDDIAVVDSPEGPIKIEIVPEQRGDYGVKSTLKVVKQLAEIGNCLLTKKAFFEEIKNHKQFDYTKDSSAKVSETLSRYNPVVLTTYYKGWPSKTIAYRNVGSNVVYLNTRFLESKPNKDRMNTLWHERAHVAGYGHGDNSSVGKGNSVPYGTGKMSEKYFNECYNQVIK